MSAAMIETHRRRLTLIAAVLLAFGVVVVLRVFQWQVLEHAKLVEWAERTNSRRHVIEPLRGAIYDRHGNVLAFSLHDEEAVGDPEFFMNTLRTEAKKKAVVQAAAPILGMPAEEIRRRLETGSGHYVRLKSSVPITVGRALMEVNAHPAIYVSPLMKRYYPNHALAAHLLGFVNMEGEGIGIEGYYDRYLRGTEGLKLIEGEVYGRGLGQVPIIQQPRDGADITLTISLPLQYMVERTLEDALRAENTITGVVIVMDPRTGEILAMASRPTFDLNKYDQVPMSMWNNLAIMGAWEPGSIFKIVTFAAALDTGKLKPNQTFVDRGVARWRGIEFRNRNNKAYGTITPAQALQYSSNLVTIQVADILSTTSFYTYTQTAFGVGAKTGIDLPGEVEGEIRMPGHLLWHISDLATQSYGQGLKVTPIQMTTMYAALANKGIMMRPYVVARVPGATDLTGGPGILRRSVKSETAAIMTEWLVSVVETTVKEARVPGYKLAGKTGTALIPPPDGTYDEDDTVASFVGYGPAEDPRFVILVRIDRPQVHKTGAEVAAPVFKSIAQWLLTYLRIPPSNVQAQR